MGEGRKKIKNEAVGKTWYTYPCLENDSIEYKDLYIIKVTFFVGSMGYRFTSLKFYLLHIKKSRKSF